MKTFKVYEWINGRWELWITVRAFTRNQAEAIVLGSNPPKRFRVV